MTKTAAALLALIVLAAPAAGQQPREARAPDTNRTVNVTKGARLTIDNFAGEVVIRSEDRDTVQVVARHSPRNKVDIQNTPAGVVVRSHGTQGPPSVDYEITAPSWMPIKVSGNFIYVSIEGVRSDVSAETIRGDISIKGGTGFITAKSIQGDIFVEGARGKVNVSTVNENIRIAGASGDIVAESNNGDVTLTRIESQSVDVSCVNGDVIYDGTIASNGRYRFATHNGDVTLGIPEGSNATFTVRTFNGDFNTTLALKAVGEVRRGRRATYIMGSGAAEVELESFGGELTVRRPGVGAPRPEKDKKDER
jgi:hypothetical protein